MTYLQLEVKHGQSCRNRSVVFSHNFSKAQNREQQKPNMSKPKQFKMDLVTRLGGQAHYDIVIFNWVERLVKDPSSTDFIPIATLMICVLCRGKFLIWQYLRCALRRERRFWLKCSFTTTISTKRVGILHYSMLSRKTLRTL